MVQEILAVSGVPLFVIVMLVIQVSFLFKESIMTTINLYLSTPTIEELRQELTTIKSQLVENQEAAASTKPPTQALTILQAELAAFKEQLVESEEAYASTKQPITFS